MDTSILLRFTGWRILITIWVILSHLNYCNVRSTSICHKECSCRNSVVNCYGKLLTRVPSDSITTHAKEFILGSNHITVIEDETFSTMAYLQVLRLNDNAISTLKPLAFLGLSRLLELNLKNDRLVDISVIRNLPLLEIINLE